MAGISFASTVGQNAPCSFRSLMDNTFTSSPFAVNGGKLSEVGE